MVAKVKNRKKYGQSDDDFENHDIHDIMNLPPDYYKMYTSMKAVGFDPSSSPFPGYRLFLMRANDAMCANSKKIVNDYIQLKMKRFKTDINLTYKRRKTFRKMESRTNSLAFSQSNHDVQSDGEYKIPTAPNDVIVPVTNKKVHKRGPRKKCCFIGCSHNERTDPNIKLI